MKYKYAVFDWDGTLADTYPVISAAYDYTFDKMGLLRIPYDEIKRITSTLQNKDTLGYVFKERRDEEKLLGFCRDKGLECYLITNKKTRFIKEELEKLGFGKYFKKVVAAGEYAEDKPHPLACHAVFDNRLPPAGEIVVIGDGEADVKTAAAFEHDGERAECIIYDPKRKYRGPEPDHKIESLIEAVAILEKE